MRVIDLKGPELDYWVAQAEGRQAKILGMFGKPPICRANSEQYPNWLQPFLPSTSWFHGGPIIERERIAVVPDLERGWGASKGYGDAQYAKDALIAAMRAYVVHAFGPEVSDPLR